MEIRNFRKSDLKNLLELLKEMVNYHRKLNSFYKPFEDYGDWNREISGWFNDKDLQVFVAEDKN